MNFAKPHYRWNGEKGKFIIMANELTEREQTGVPDWMKRASTGATLGNIDSSDLKPPKLKLLAGMSPEVMDGIPGAQPGNFWITILNQNLGQSVIITPILLRKSYHIWAPKTGETKGPLATASDGIHWDQPNQTFEIRFPNNPNPYKWTIGKLVTDHGVNKFGSSQPDDPKSKPIATLTYDILVLLELPNGKKQLCVWTAARTGVTPTMNFISTVMAMNVDQFYQRYRIVVLKKPGPSGDAFFTFDYQYVGNIQSEDEGKANRALYDQYRRSGFVVDLGAEADDISANRPQREQYTAPRDEDSDQIPF